jgi:hypothetical protein
MTNDLKYVLQVLDRARTERVSETELLAAMEIVRKLQTPVKPANPLLFPTLSLAS